MKRLVVVIVIVVAVAVVWGVVRRLVPSDIEYQGEKVKLTKFYLDYDNYKNDPENIDASENARIERLVSEAHISGSFGSREQMLRAVFDIQFPGYGLSCFGEKPQSDGSVLAGFSVEIPRANKERLLTFRRRKSTYTLIDDFIHRSYPAIMSVREEDGALVYSTMEGKAVVARPLAPKRSGAEDGSVSR